MQEVNLPNLPLPQELRQRKAKQAIEQRDRAILVRIMTKYGPMNAVHLASRNWMRWVCYCGNHARRATPIERLVLALGARA